ncbi:MAG: lytic transglycosylase domain-containing protein [Gammaproteobacteria bacterium]|nr:lytic transglycosylase domain-containing protein [Gammaproteobacteria bacterium]
MLNIIFILFALLPLSCFSANGIKQSENEGVVEFSNFSTTKSTQKTIIYKSESNNTVTFSDQKPSNVTYEILRFDCFACNPHSAIDWNTVKLNLTAFSETVNKVAQYNHVDPALVRALIHAESAFNAQATSRAGAQGLMQLMPATAKELGVTNSLNPQQNINGGVKYLAKLLEQFKGDIRLATAAYNAGPNAVKKYNGIPPYKETQVYVERVGILHRRYQKAI